MATVGITINTRLAQQAYRQLRERAPVAISRALNRAGGSARTVMVREVAKDLGITQAKVRSQYTTGDASPRQLVFRLSTTGKRIPLIEFKARGPEPSRGRGRGVTAKLPGGAGRYPRAFITTVGVGGHRGVFERKRQARLPIRELFGPSLPKVFGKFLGVGLARGTEALAKNLQHEIKFELSQIRKASGL